MSDFEQLVAVLYTKGYYSGLVDIKINGIPLEQSIEDNSQITVRPVPVSLSISPGPLFHFGQTSVSYSHLEDADRTKLPDVMALGITSGAPALSDKIFKAESKALIALADLGYPHAKVGPRKLLANHATHSLKVHLAFNAGPKARFGPVTVKGSKSVSADFIKTYANIPEGETYSDTTIRKTEDRLRDLGVFSSISIKPSPIIKENGSQPITIEVSERASRVFGLGANWSSNEGLGLEGYWTHRNLFGSAEKLTLSGSLGQISDIAGDDLEYAAGLAFEKPGAFGPATKFTSSINAARERPDSYESRSITADAFYHRKINEHLKMKVGGEAFYGSEEDVLGAQDYFFIGAPAYLTYDKRNNKLNPTRGYEGILYFEPAADLRISEALLFSKASFSNYVSLDKKDRWVIATRVSTGVEVSNGLTKIPPSRRFYLGGGGTVRGYAYNNIGPRVDDEVTGGRSFFLVNGELRVKLTSSIGAVGFLDAGSVYDSILPDFSSSFQIGVGLGLRYFTPVGPLRLDVGVPLSPEKDDPPVAVYIGLSQSF
ncbi:autotransporter assembly complex protein TamA [Flexibacterium corallicola]|uniref:autotransporter assembly complex protein TamA n=1 Tax=Flexibacterium corallicola TaxID=3037259 RepID=UPI00286F62EE|nr:autotransporter assembly complex family protein [Pseudovibrio sp. M1P-2-3]